MTFPRGSEWRKWDLHIHTPASFHWNGPRFTGDKAQDYPICKTVVESINSVDAAVFATMDYWTFDGFIKIREYLASPGATQLTKTLFPGIELRVTAPTDFRLNIHVLLSDKLTDNALKTFRSSLRIVHKSHVDGAALSDDSLIEFARTLTAPQAAKHGVNDIDNATVPQLLELGQKSAEITKESLVRAVESLPPRSCIIYLPYDTSDGISALDHTKHPSYDHYMLGNAHMFECKHEDNIKLFLGIKTDANKAFIADFQKAIGKPKPVIRGSDAHKISEYAKFPNDRCTWIKADPTFSGLLQILEEPSNRCFIGKEPPELLRVRSASSKYISSISVTPTGTLPPENIWFDFTIPINTNMVAIIGNKGNGKSALTDIMGLLGNAHIQEKDFSFLNKERFRKPKLNLSERFKGQIVYESSELAEKLLSQNCDYQSPQRVKYITKDKIEEICTQVADGEDNYFSKELQDIIFSHVDEPNKMGKESLSDLINYHSETINQEIDKLKKEVWDKNKNLASLESKITPASIKILTETLAAKQNELTILVKAKPDAVVVPKNVQVDAETQKQIDLLNTTIQSYDAGILNTQAELKKYIGAINSFDKIIFATNTIVEEHAAIQRDVKQLPQELKLDEKRIISLATDSKYIAEIKKKIADKKDELSKKLDTTHDGSLVSKRKNCIEELASIKDKLDQPNKDYQAYQEQLKAWETRRQELIGNPEKFESIKYYEAELGKAKVDYPKQIAELEISRNEIAKSIYEKLQEIVKVYSTLHKPIQDFLLSKEDLADGLKIEFIANLTLKDFERVFLENLINRSKKGSFLGVDDSNAFLKSIIEESDFDSWPTVLEFINKILNALKLDARLNNEPREIISQLKNPFLEGIEDLYDYLFTLDYLIPKYKLTHDGKELSQLSSGEKGTLLLVFYLLLDKGDIPLVIDQPEDNLDNETIFHSLVPCIREAKSRRQLILVTHNPNLAVVCDAEQIIHCSIDKKNSNKVSYISGSMESPAINEKVQNVLEGTLRAFRNRGSKYYEGKKG